VLSIKFIYLELLISHFIRPVESAELPNVARVSRSLETPGLEQHFLSNQNVVLACQEIGMQLSVTLKTIPIRIPFNLLPTTQFNVVLQCT
jgi:hypothetical protein